MGSRVDGGARPQPQIQNQQTVQDTTTTQSTESEVRTERTDRAKDSFESGTFVGEHTDGYTGIDDGASSPRRSSGTVSHQQRVAACKPKIIDHAERGSEYQLGRVRIESGGTLHTAGQRLIDSLAPGAYDKFCEEALDENTGVGRMFQQWIQNNDKSWPANEARTNAYLQQFTTEVAVEYALGVDGGLGDYREAYPHTPPLNGMPQSVLNDAGRVDARSIPAGSEIILPLHNGEINTDEITPDEPRETDDPTEIEVNSDRLYLGLDKSGSMSQGEKLDLLGTLLNQLQEKYGDEGVSIEYRAFGARSNQLYAPQTLEGSPREVIARLAQVMDVSANAVHQHAGRLAQSDIDNPIRGSRAGRSPDDSAGEPVGPCLDWMAERMDADGGQAILFTDVLPSRYEGHPRGNTTVVNVGQ